jgi:L-ribulose-5-phosphate 4-epimerase
MLGRYNGQQVMDITRATARCEMDFDRAELELREQLVEMAIQTYRRGLAAGSGGNLSVRIPGREEVLVTATGLSLEKTTVENIVKSDLQARQIGDSSRYRPSKENRFHCAVYRARPDVGAVVHTHAPYATALSFRNADLPLVTVTARMSFTRVPCIALAMSGSDELSGFVEAAYAADETVQAILMRAHGVIAAGASLDAAFNRAEMVEDTAKAAHLLLALGISLEEAEETVLQAVPERSTWLTY